MAPCRQAELIAGIIIKKYVYYYNHDKNQYLF